MLTKGIDTSCFVMMHRRVGFELSTKGVVCPFLTPEGLSFDH